MQHELACLFLVWELHYDGAVVWCHVVILHQRWSIGLPVLGLIIASVENSSDFAGILSAEVVLCVSEIIG